jgi:hypothetical protein
LSGPALLQAEIAAAKISNDAVRSSFGICLVLFELFGCSVELRGLRTLVIELRSSGALIVLGDALLELGERCGTVRCGHVVSENGGADDQRDAKDPRGDT